jgi:hypothetical protein
MFFLLNFKCVHACSVAVMSDSCKPMDCIACQTPLPMGFSRQEYCSGLPFLSPVLPVFYTPIFVRYLFYKSYLLVYSLSFHSLSVIHRKDFFNLLKYKLPFFSFVDCIWKVIAKPRSPRFSPMLYSESLTVLHFAFKNSEI